MFHSSTFTLLNVPPTLLDCIQTFRTLGQLRRHTDPKLREEYHHDVRFLKKLCKPIASENNPPPPPIPPAPVPSYMTVTRMVPPPRVAAEDHARAYPEVSFDISAFTFSRLSRLRRDCLSVRLGSAPFLIMLLRFTGESQICGRTGPLNPNRTGVTLEIRSLIIGKDCLLERAGSAKPRSKITSTLLGAHNPRHRD